MGEERVRDPAQPGQRLVVAVGDRLFGNVSAGQHHRTGRCGEQQVMQRGVRQHDPELAVARRRRRGDGRLRAPGQQHDRPGQAGQQVGGRGIDLDQPPGRGQVRDHDRERLVLTVLAGPQPRDGLLAGGVDGEVIAAKSFHGQDPALSQQSGRLRQRVAAGQVAAGQVTPRPGRPRPGGGAPGGARRPGSRWAVRESGGRPGHGIRRRTARTSRRSPWLSAAGRRARHGRW